MLRYFSVIMNGVIEVPVSGEIETYVKRSYWRESKQKERYYARCKALEEGFGFERCDDLNFEKIVFDEQVKILKEVMHNLDENELYIIQQFYFGERTMTEIAKSMEKSLPYVSKKHKSALSHLRDLFYKRYGYGV